MVQAISGIRPYVSAVPTITQQQRVERVRLDRNEIADDLKNGKISDMEAMSRRAALTSNMSDAKTSATSSSQRVEVVGVDRSAKPASVGMPKDIQPANMYAVDRNQKGKELSRAEKQQALDNQMNQMAINNMVLHGLPYAVAS